MSDNLNAAEVRVGITGAVYSAPRTTTAPTDSSTALAAAWIGHGYVGDEGVRETYSDSVTNIVAWQNAQVVRAARTESTASFQFKLIQTRGSNLELFHPGSRIEANLDEWKLEVKPASADPRSFVFDVIDGEDFLRMYVGNGEVVERSEIAHRNGEPRGYEVTVMAYPDNDGNLMVKFSNSAAWGLDITGP